MKIMKLNVSSDTVKNTVLKDKPNEDILYCDKKKNLFILLDGVSRDKEKGIYPNPSPAAEVVEIMVEEIRRTIDSAELQEGKISDLIMLAIQNANHEVGLYNKERKLSFAAGAVGIISIIYQGFIYYAYIGDCYGRLFYGDRVFLFTKCQTELISKHKKEYTAYEIRELICNNKEHPYAYGVLNGDERAMDFICTGKMDITDVEHIILSSDGLEKFIASSEENLLKEKNADELLREAIIYNNEKQDDRTIIKIDF